MYLYLHQFISKTCLELQANSIVMQRSRQYLAYSICLLKCSYIIICPLILYNFTYDSEVKENLVCLFILIYLITTL